MTDGPTRRRVLRLAGATAFTATAATLADLGTTTGSAAARTSRRSVAGRSLNAAADPAGHIAVVDATRAPTPAWARPWHHPIDTLADFVHRDRQAHFARTAIMLTIDDGPSPEWTPKYLALLAKYRIPATFCMIGRQVRSNRDLAKDVRDHGHVIANHTWTHDERLAFGSPAHIRAEITRTQDAIHAATGYTPNQFRNPGGAWGSAVYAELARARMMPLGWSVDPRDWARPGAAAIEHTMLRARPHQIILCHDGGGDRAETYRALRTVIPALLRRGYTFVTLPRG
ncbi:polysaccharide deacetylase family protein [uncultured Jatrophihabitans sp.]|uniref:polysaccharide deacetylase family protein n=1 Tax=uncultured Jatrophihabitans sp. TaxID=1610747 RepID=UPI0035C9C418